MFNENFFVRIDSPGGSRSPVGALAIASVYRFATREQQPVAQRTARTPCGMCCKPDRNLFSARRRRKSGLRRLLAITLCHAPATGRLQNFRRSLVWKFAKKRAHTDRHASRAPIFKPASFTAHFGNRIRTSPPLPASVRSPGCAGHIPRWCLRY